MKLLIRWPNTKQWIAAAMATSLVVLTSKQLEIIAARVRVELAVGCSVYPIK
jgi:hypothetical protein